MRVAIACAALLAATADAADTEKLNLLMIISDQHRWDVAGHAGNDIIKTPNLDQLAKDGVHFSKAYTICPVCCPSRTSMLAGRTPEQTQVRGNREMATGPRQNTYDRVLLANGWGGEYHGKYHSPYNYTRDASGATYYTKPVRWLNGDGPIGCTPAGSSHCVLYNQTANASSGLPTGVQSLSTAYRAYLDKHEPLIPLQLGQLMEGMYQRPYWADVADKRYNQTTNKTLLALTNRLIAEGNAHEVSHTDQQHVNGRLALSANHSYSALTLNEGLAAMDRLKAAPFTLTVSFEAPHPPFVIPSPFYGLYDNDTIPDPWTVEDPMTASPYHHPHSPSGDEAQVRQQRSNYYGMVAQNDKMVGDLLSRLEELTLTPSTLVIYVADHGEMLGDHHMQSKMVFYEGGVHVPLIMRLPGVIAAGTVVSAPVSNVALFGTILDYLGLPGIAPSTSKSLRPLIEGMEDANQTRVIFSFWDSDISPGFMAFDGRFKLMIGRTEKTSNDQCDALVERGPDAPYFTHRSPCGVDEQGFDAPGVDALYDLRYDPMENINLLRSPFVKKPLSALHQSEKDNIVPFERATSLKATLVSWLKETDSQYMIPVTKRQMNTSHINQIPMLVTSIAAPTWKVGKPNTMLIPASTFLDVDGDTLHYAGSLDRGTLPGWLKVHPKDGSVHGTPPSKGAHLLRVTAADHKTGSAFVELQMTVE